MRQFFAKRHLQHVNRSLHNSYFRIFSLFFNCLIKCLNLRAKYFPKFPLLDKIDFISQLYHFICVDFISDEFEVFSSVLFDYTFWLSPKTLFFSSNISPSHFIFHQPFKFFILPSQRLEGFSDQLMDYEFVMLEDISLLIIESEVFKIELGFKLPLALLADFVNSCSLLTLQMHPFYLLGDCLQILGSLAWMLGMRLFPHFLTFELFLQHFAKVGHAIDRIIHGLLGEEDIVEFNGIIDALDIHDIK